MVLAIDQYGFFSLLKEEKISLEKIQQPNTIDRIRNHDAKSDTLFQRGTLSRNVRHCQPRSLSNLFDAVSFYHTVFRTGKCCFTVSYESVLILTILHHIVYENNGNEYLISVCSAYSNIQ